MARIGPNWATAMRSNSHSALGLTRGEPPWKEVEKVMTQTGANTSTLAFVARHVRNLTHTYYSFAP
eukprot:1210244-Pleurochrysis_carterae.AAC.1